MCAQIDLAVYIQDHFVDVYSPCSANPNSPTSLKQSGISAPTPALAQKMVFITRADTFR